MSTPAPAIKTVCSWCGTVLTDGPAAPVSHGVCPACAAGVRARRATEARVVETVDECFYCTAEYTGPPVTSEEQRFYLGFERALRFCSTSCLANAAEEYGMRQAERNLR